MLSFERACIIAIIVVSLFCSNLYSFDQPFNTPSNIGTTGLMEIPSARTIKENSYTLGISQIEPYRYYYVVFSPLKNLEITGRITEILNVPASNRDPKWKGYGNYKDKAFDLKYKLISESKFLPAIAIGIMDPHGTRLYSSQYIVASKQIYPFNFTLGFGNGRFGEKQLDEKGEGFRIEMIQSPIDWLKDSKFFGGIQFAPNEKFALMIEYSPIEYHKQKRDPAQKKYFKTPVPSHFNYGIRFKPFDWMDIDITYQRGQKIGANLSFNFEIGRPLIPIIDREVKLIDNYLPLEEQISKSLELIGFSDIAVYIIEEKLNIELQNDKYFYLPKALEMVFKVINQINNRDFEDIDIIIKSNGIVLIKLSTRVDIIKEYFNSEITKNELYLLMDIETDVYKKYKKVEAFKKRLKYGLKPSFQTFLNDPSGFFKYRLGLTLWTSFHLWDGNSFVTAIEGYPINTVSTVNEPLSIPVRTDLPFYMKEKVSLGRLMVDQINKFPFEIYTRFSLGLLEIQYAGLDFEVAKPFFDGRLFLGINSCIAKKRVIGSPFRLDNKSAKDYYFTGFFNMRLNIPERELSIDLKTGRFLAGDFGTRITVSKFINGVVVSGWYSFTDTSIFRDKLNSGYHDKGISISIPIRLFEGTDSKTSYFYSLSPWTRDVAQDISHYNNLFDFIGRNQKIYLDKDKFKR
jgi:hypothetical protein